MLRKILVLCAPQGLDVARAVGTWFDREQLGPVEINPATSPPPWEPGVAAFVVASDDLAADVDLVTACTGLHRADFPLCLLVPDLGAYRFDALPTALPMFGERNALAWDDHTRILQTARTHLGLAPPALRRSVLLSYAREDGRDACARIKEHLEANNYRVFHDLEAIVGGERVQATIDEYIEELDFMLYLESAAAGASPWVEHELHTARRLRVPVARVRLDGADTYAGFRATPALDWRPDRHDNEERVLGFCNTRLGAREKLDISARRAIHDAGRALGAEVSPRTRLAGRRCYRLMKGRRQVLIQHSDEWPGLEGLHALSQDVREELGSGGAGVLLSAATRLPDPLLEAVQWARGQERLEVGTGRDLISRLKLLLTEEPSP